MRTRVGYSGGTKVNPEYYSLGDHSETIEIDYDPGVISYKELLQVFWMSHDPTRQAWSRQYMAAVFYHNEEQKRLAEVSRDSVQERLHRNIVTRIIPAAQFYLAEGYHQKYRLRNQPDLMEEFTRTYPDERDFINSTAAARINGFLYGYGSAEEVDSEIDRLGLPPEMARKLHEYVNGR